MRVFNLPKHAIPTCATHETAITQIQKMNAMLLYYDEVPLHSYIHNALGGDDVIL